MKRRKTATISIAAAPTRTNYTKVQQAWVFLVTSCKGVAFDIVNAEESASEAWAKLVQHYQVSGLK